MFKADNGSIGQLITTVLVEQILNQLHQLVKDLQNSINLKFEYIQCLARLRLTVSVKGMQLSSQLSHF